MKDLEELKKPFPEREISWRVQSAWERDGRIGALVVPYLTNREIQERLDSVCGMTGWKNEFHEAPGGGVLCGISIWVEHEVGGEWVTKWDGAENTELSAIKGGLSGSMKRAAAQWGIGRYLYSCPAGFANIHDKGQIRTTVKIGPKEHQKKVTIQFDPPSIDKLMGGQGGDHHQAGAPDPAKQGSAGKSGESQGKLPTGITITAGQVKRLQDYHLDPRTEHLRSKDGSKLVRDMIKNALNAKPLPLMDDVDKLIHYIEACFKQMAAEPEPARGGRKR